MASNNRNLTSQAVINGHKIPVYGWQCHLTSYGNLNTFEVQTSIQQVLNSGYKDIFQDQTKIAAMECQILLIDNTEGSSQVVFDGIIDTIEAKWEIDELEICGRDFSAVLRDTAKVLDKYVNMPISKVIEDIAKQNGLQTSITATDQIAGITASTFQGQVSAFASAPKPLWHMIQELADEVGYLAWVDNHKTLVFQPEAQGKQSHTYYWRPTATPDGADQKPILTLNIMQQSRRCLNFTLRLIGYDQSTKQHFLFERSIGTGGGEVKTFRRSDINAQNVESITKSIADSIQRKNLVVKAVVEGTTEVNVNDKLKIIETTDGELLGLNNKDLFIVSIMQSFQMPEHNSTEGTGFLTHITANQITNIDTNSSG